MVSVSSVKVCFLDFQLNRRSTLTVFQGPLDYPAKRRKGVGDLRLGITINPEPNISDQDSYQRAFLTRALRQLCTNGSALASSRGVLDYTAKLNKDLGHTRAVYPIDYILYDCSGTLSVSSGFRASSFLTNADVALGYSAMLQRFVEWLCSYLSLAEVPTKGDGYGGLLLQGQFAPPVDTESRLQPHNTDFDSLSTSSGLRELSFPKNTDDALIKSDTNCSVELLYSLRPLARSLVSYACCGGTHLQSKQSTAFVGPRLASSPFHEFYFPSLDYRLPSSVAEYSVSNARSRSTHHHTKQSTAILDPQPTPPEPQPSLPPYHSKQSTAFLGPQPTSPEPQPSLPPYNSKQGTAILDPQPTSPNPQPSLPPYQSLLPPLNVGLSVSDTRSGGTSLCSTTLMDNYGHRPNPVSGPWVPTYYRL